MRCRGIRSPALPTAAHAASGHPTAEQRDEQAPLARYLKFKNPTIDVTVRDLEGIEETIVIPSQQPQVRRYLVTFWDSHRRLPFLGDSHNLVVR
jgi:hypothetical protein